MPGWVAASFFVVSLCTQPHVPKANGHDLDYWRPRTLPPFSKQERVEAILAVKLLGRASFLGFAKDDEGVRWVTQNVVPVLAKLLDDEDAEIRGHAATAVCWCPREASEATIPRMIELLTDPSERIRSSAVASLTFRGRAAEPAVPQLLAVLEKDASKYVREEAARALRTAGPVGVAALEKRFDSTDRDTRTAAVRAFEFRYGTPELPNTPAGTLPLLLNKLDDPDPQVQVSAGTAIGRYEPFAADAIAKVLRHPNRDVRDTAFSTLLIPSQQKPPPCVDEMLAALQADRELLRKHVRYVSRLGPATIPWQIEMLDDAEAKVRGNAAEGLRTHGPAAVAAVPKLKQLLADMNVVHGDSMTRVCHRAASALNAIAPGTDYTSGLPPLRPDGK